VSNPQRTKGRLQFLLIAAIFFGPLLFAAWLYYSGDGLQPESRVNHGALLEPIVNLLDAVPESRIHDDRAWRLLYAEDGECGERCQQALYTLRQTRLMLGKEMDRVERVFLHGEHAPDTLLGAEEHQGLKSLHDPALRAVLDEQRPGSLPAGGFYLIDPHANLVLYFSPDIKPRDMVDDIKRLLKLSRIG
jgi:hypothetical protein